MFKFIADIERRHCQKMVVLNRITGAMEKLSTSTLELPFIAEICDAAGIPKFHAGGDGHEYTLKERVKILADRNICAKEDKDKERNIEKIAGLIKRIETLEKQIQK